MHLTEISPSPFQLGLSLAVDGSKDNKLWIKNIPDIEIGDWRRHDESQDQVQEIKLMHSDDLNEATNQLIQRRNDIGNNETTREVKYDLRKANEQNDKIDENRHSDYELKNDK